MAATGEAERRAGESAILHIDGMGCPLAAELRDRSDDGTFHFAFRVGDAEEVAINRFIGRLAARAA